MAQRFNFPREQVFSDLGAIGAGYKLYTYSTGTTTPLATYSDTALSAANANPTIADSTGRFGNIFVNDLSLYKAILKDSNDNTIWTADPIDPKTFSLADFSPRPTSFWGTTAGTASAYTLDADPNVSAYSSTDTFFFACHLDCNAAPTISVDGLTALNLKKYDGTGNKLALLVGDMLSGQRYEATNDGTDIIILNPESQNLNNITGAIMAFAMDTPPSGWLECNGSTISRTTYAALFAKIGDVFGVGDGSTTFKIPDLRGQFIRGWDHGAGTDPDAASRTDSGDGSTTGDNVGTKQTDAFQGHYHQVVQQASNTSTGAGGIIGTATTSITDTNTIGVAISDGTNGTPRLTSETRPTNIYMMYCIKY